MPLPDSTLQRLPKPPKVHDGIFCAYGSGGVGLLCGVDLFGVGVVRRLRPAIGSTCVVVELLRVGGSGVARLVTAKMQGIFYSHKRQSWGFWDGGRGVFMKYYYIL